MSIATGSKRGPCETLTLIGAGGTGKVYRARDTKFKRDLTLNQPRPWRMPPKRSHPSRPEAKDVKLSPDSDVRVLVDIKYWMTRRPSFAQSRDTIAF